MSVPRNKMAISLLRDLLDGPTDSTTTRRGTADDLVEPWDGDVVRRPPDQWLWTEESEPAMRNLRDPDAYVLAYRGPDLDSNQMERWTELLHKSPSEVIDTAEELGALERSYCRSSVDLTMRGGTTSGVVYPAAVCEIARSFRLRNIGGASAGAIAAAVAAAAERGRSMAGAVATAADHRATVREGVFQPGFAGLADATAWFSELDREDATSNPEFRVAQLFRPKPEGLQLFRLFAASMQSSAKSLRMLVLVLAYGGWRMRLLRLFAVVCATLIAATAVVSEDVITRVAVGFSVLLAGTLKLAALLMIVGYFLNRRSRQRQQRRADRRVAEPVATMQTEARSIWQLLLPVALLLAVAGGITALLLWEDGTTLDDWPLVALTWLVATGFQVTLPLILLFPSLTKAKSGHFGLIGGSTGVSEISGKRAHLLNKVAGLRTSPVERALVPWLSGAMSSVAGLATSVDGQPPTMTEGTVLRFGHLWSAGYVSPAPGEEPEQDRLVEEATNPRARVVNLELVTSELTHQVPWRFPLTPDQIRCNGVAQLYVSRADLERVFPPEVVAAMTHRGCQSQVVRNMETGEELLARGHEQLFELPDMCDIPVIVPTRMSLAFPAMFEALRLYQRVCGPEDEAHLVRDEYGSRLGKSGANESIAFPVEHPDDPQTLWLQELWFTDGGVTANFPVHFFDSVLPLWPTLGVNLGPHPAGHAHQDVWLPADNQSRTLPPAPLRDALTGFIGSIFQTARGWRDTYQTSMPAFRGRVAWVRQRPNEGGNNLFMTPDLIASLALRGALAGRRLRKRFEQDAYWRRHQWLRLRIAADNLERLRQGLRVACLDRGYQTLTGRDALAALRSELDGLGGDPTPASPPAAPIIRSDDGQMDWFESDDEAYWSQVTALLTAYQSATAGPALREGTPSPRPVLSQIPPI